MCLRPRKVYTACSHTDELGQEDCTEVRLVKAARKIGGVFVPSWARTTCGPPWAQPICFSRVDYRLSYGFCPACAADFSMSGELTETTLLNYWAYKNSKGLRRPVNPAVIPHDVLFGSSAAYKADPREQRLEMLTLSEALHMWDQPEDFMNSKAYDYGDGPLNLLEYLEEIRTITLRKARRLKSAHTSIPTPSASMPLSSMTPSTSPNSHGRSPDEPGVEMEATNGRPAHAPGPSYSALKGVGPQGITNTATHSDPAEHMARVRDEDDSSEVVDLEVRYRSPKGKGKAVESPKRGGFQHAGGDDFVKQEHDARRPTSFGLFSVSPDPSMLESLATSSNADDRHSAGPLELPEETNPTIQRVAAEHYLRDAITIDPSLVQHIHSVVPSIGIVSDCGGDYDSDDNTSEGDSTIVSENGETNSVAESPPDPIDLDSINPLPERSYRSVPSPQPTDFHVVDWERPRPDSETLGADGMALFQSANGSSSASVSPRSVVDPPGSQPDRTATPATASPAPIARDLVPTLYSPAHTPDNIPVPQATSQSTPDSDIPPPPAPDRNHDSAASNPDSPLRPTATEPAPLTAASIARAAARDDRFPSFIPGSSTGLAAPAPLRAPRLGTPPLVKTPSDAVRSMYPQLDGAASPPSPGRTEARKRRSAVGLVLPVPGRFARGVGGESMVSPTMPRSAPPFPTRAVRGFEEAVAVPVCFCGELGRKVCECPAVVEPALWM